MNTRPHILRRAFHDKLLMILKANRISFYDYDAFMYKERMMKISFQFDVSVIPFTAFYYDWFERIPSPIHFFLLNPFLIDCLD